MIPEEFKIQIFKTPEQWGSGLLYRLDAKENGGITLYQTPAFAEWIIQVKNILKNPVGLAVDECGQIYILDSDTTSRIYRLYRYDCETQNLEQLSYIVDSDLCLAVDECIQIYPFNSNIKPKIRKLNHNGCGTTEREQLSDVADCNSGQKNECPKRMLLSKYTLWVNDTMNKRVLAFSREDYQITNIINKLNDEIIEPIDIGMDERGNLYVLTKKSDEYQIIKYDEYGNQIVNYDEYGNLINSFRLIEPDVSEAIGLASGKRDTLYVIDGGNKHLNKYIENGSNLVLDYTIDLSKEGISNLQRSGIVVDGKGNIFLSYFKNVDGSRKEFIQQFDPDGSSLGIVKSFEEDIQGFTVDSEGDLYISSNKGICKLITQNTFTREVGTYYSKTLDSGILGCQWHGIVLEADIPPKTVVEISFVSADISADDSSLQKKIDEIITEKKLSKQKKAKAIDKLLTDAGLNWSEPERFSSKYLNSKEKNINQQPSQKEPLKNRESMLFRNKQGRYLWLRVKLLTFDEKVSPAITQMKIHYPRISYLRYLPAIYQENPASSEFLERFLSIFEIVSNDLETKISQIHKYFDPETVPQNFLNWLASWLNVALEEDWQEEKKRQLIQEAYILYKQKGTPSGIERLIEIYTGKKPVLLEDSKIKKPMVLRENGKLALGVNSLLIETPFSGLRLGNEAILGRIILRDPIQSPEDPFLPMAHRFTVTLDFSDDEKILFEKQLRRILDDEKPANTMYNLRFSSGTKEMETYVGINTKIDYYRSLRLGAEATIGNVVVVTNGERGGRIEKSSIVGVDTELI
jgi:phage tail-like protein